MELKITPVNKEAEEQGVWTNYLGVELLIARATNETYKREFIRLTRPYDRQIKKQSLDERTTRKLLAQAAAKGLLLGWRNFVIDGEEVPYSRDNALSLLMHDPDCLDFVMEFSQDVDNYISEEVDGVVKES